MLAPALGGHRGLGALDDLQQGLLHALAGHVAGDGGVLALAGDLVYLVDVDDAPLGPLHVVVRGLQQVEDDVLHILAHVAGLGQGGGVGNGEGHVENLGQGLGQEGLAAAGGAHQQDVGLLQLHPAHFHLGVNTLVVVVHRHGQDLLGPLLLNHVLVHYGLDFHGLGNGDAAGGLFLLIFFLDDLVAQLDALIADVYRRAGDELLDLILALAAEGTDQIRTLAVSFLGHIKKPPSAVANRCGA